MFITCDVQNKQKGNDYTSEGSACQGMKSNFVKVQKDHKGSAQENKIKKKKERKKESIQNEVTKEVKKNSDSTFVLVSF